MPRKMSPEREKEYADLASFVDFYATYVMRIDPSSAIHPTNVGLRIAAEHGRSKALEGLKMAVNDIVEELRTLPVDGVQLIDAAAQGKGLLTLSTIRRRYSASYARVLKRGIIRDDAEYYLIAGQLADQSAGCAEEEVAVLQRLVDEYEVRQVGDRAG